MPLPPLAGWLSEAPYLVERVLRAVLRRRWLRRSRSPRHRSRASEVSGESVKWVRDAGFVLAWVALGAATSRAMPKVGFDGYQRGLLVRAGPRVVPRGFVRDAMNVVFPAGRVRSRPGLAPAHGAAFPNPIRGMGTHIRTDASRDYLIASGAALYRMPLYGDPILLSLAGLPSTENTRVDPTGGVRFLSLSGADSTTFIFDGVNPSLKWTGNSLSKMGLPTPTAPSAPTSIGGAAIGAGVRDYYRTLKTAFHESDLSEGLSVTQGATGGKRFASPVNGVVPPNDYDDPQVTKWALYRSQSGFAKRYFVGEADIGLPITDNLVDAVVSVDSALAESFVNRPPDTPPFNGKFITLVEHQSHVWGVDTYDRSLVRFSHGTDQYIAPEGWPEAQVIPIAHGDGDEITALASFFDWLVVFKQLSTWAIVGSLDAGYQVVPILAASGGKRLGIGCIAPDAILHLENQLIFPSRDGFYLLERFQGAQAGVAAKKLSDPIDRIFNCTNFALGAAALYDRSRQVHVFFGHGLGLVALAKMILGGILTWYA